MPRDNTLQGWYLIGFNIDKQHMLARFDFIAEAFEVVMHFLNAKQPAFPGAEAERNNG